MFTTPDDDSELVQAKWLSLDNHVHDVHRRHSTKFPKCSHGRLRRRDRKKSGLKDISRTYPQCMYSDMDEHVYY